jgi:hypothetical protein
MTVSERRYPSFFFRPNASKQAKADVHHDITKRLGWVESGSWLGLYHSAAFGQIQAFRKKKARRREPIDPGLVLSLAAQF